MKEEGPNVGARVRVKLLRLAKERGDDFQLVLLRYVTPAPQEIEFPALLDYPAPRLRAYPRETHVAEKLEAMVKLGLANSRMKDFYDVAELAALFPFEGEALAAAIRATFDRRGTPLPATTPVAFTPAFFEDAGKRAQWAGFVRRAGIQHGVTLAEVVQRVERFAAKPLAAARGARGFRARWPAGGPWSDAA